jgi:hypothetical protein
MPLITCPNCKHQFEPTDAMRDAIEKELRSKMIDWQKKKEEEFKQKEAAFAAALKEQQEKAEAKLAAEKRQLEQTLQEQLRKQLSADFENQLRLLQEHNQQQEEKLKQARQKELDYLRKEQELLNKEQELELRLQKLLLEKRAELSETIRKEEAEKMALKEREYQLQLQELNQKLEQQKKLAEEMKRKAEQGSMQSQGEAQEVLLEELLRHAFPLDHVAEVGKGVRGADCIMTVRNKLGQDCGKIIFESKRTQAFAADWIEKLKADMRSQGADVAVLVTTAMPKDMERFGDRDGIWICSFAEVKALVHLLRDSIIKIAAAQRSHENKGDKMELLYNYLTSNDFTERWKGIREGFLAMQDSIARERMAMEKLWKAREAQIGKVLTNLAAFKGSIEGIAGQEFDLNLLDDSTQPLLE